MSTLSLDGWLVLGTAIIVTFVAVAEVIEGWNSSHRVFASLVFKNKYEQRLCRILWSIAAPLFFILGSGIYLFEQGISAKIFLIVFLGILLFAWRYILEIMLYAFLGVGMIFVSDIFFPIKKFIIDGCKEACSKNAWNRFKNWLWN